MYKLKQDCYGNLNGVILEDKWMTIPFDPANTDYQAYLQWLAEGNEPLPADEPEGQTE